MFDKLTIRSKLLEKSLDAAWLRNDVITQNLANVDTPGYKRKTVAFEEFLDSALDGSSFKGQRTDKRHVRIGGSDVDSVNSSVTQDNTSLSYRLDGNNVDAESENAALAKNALKYNTMIQLLNSQLKRVKTSISEGRK